MLHYLCLRGKILGRQLAGLGGLRLLLLGPLLLFGLRHAVLLLVARPAGQWVLALLGAGLCWSGHRSRPDLGFLQTAAPRFREWLLAEYVLWQLPVWLVLLAYGNWPAALLSLGALLLITYLPNPLAARPRRRHRSRWRSEAFEWVSGYRRTGAWLIWAVGLGVAGWQRTTVAPVLALAAWALVLTSFYTLAEDPLLLVQYPLAPGAFLRRKLRLGLGFYVLSSLPFVGLMGLGTSAWGGALAVLAWGALVLGLVILTKYAFYPHAAPMQAGVVALALLVGVNSLYAALLAACLLGILWKSRQRLLLYQPPV